MLPLALALIETTNCQALSISQSKVTYNTQVWYIIGIISSSPTHFHSEKIGLIRVTYDPLTVLGKASLLFSNERKNQAKVPIVYAQLNSSNPCFIICFSISKEICSELLFIHVALNKKSFWNTKCVWCNRLLHRFNLIICSRKIFECALTLYYLINDSMSPLNFAC